MENIKQNRAMISKKSLKINRMITKLPSRLLSNNVQAIMQGGNGRRAAFTCLSSGNEVGKQRCSGYGRVLESSESYGGFPSILHASLAKVKKNLGTFFMKDKTEQFSDFIFG